MTDRPNDPWFDCLPSCATHLQCGQGWHTIRWEAGELRLLNHPDAEGELVLAALGGDKARCVEVAEAWTRHAEDLSVLAVGPRSAADKIAVSWFDVDAAARATQRRGQRGYLPPAGGSGRLPPAASGLRPATAFAAGAWYGQAAPDRERAARRRSDMLSLLALGYGFQVRLIGQVAAAHASRPEAAMEKIRPPLVAAITARLAPVAEEWLGIDPDQVVVTLHRGPGWGSAELTGRAGQRRLRVSLPARWLGQVWAAGLSLTGRHLVVAVAQGGWPDARVLALRAPGTEPVPLDVHATVPGAVSESQEVRPDAAHAPHWVL